MAIDKSTARRHLDKRLSRFRPPEEFVRPQRGWIRAIRDAIGMTGSQLAKRLKVSPPRVPELEKAEVEGRVTLDSLERAARAMGCTLVYALVPNRPLEGMVQDRARQIAERTLARVDQTMRLEAQGVDDADDQDDARARLITRLVHDKIRTLWNQP